MNNVSLIGRLVRDPELRMSGANKDISVCRFTIAVDNGFGENKKTSFIPIVVFKKVAENCDKYLKKGSQVGVTGYIQTGSYEKDGRTIYTTDVNANNVEFLSTKSGEKVAEAPASVESTEGFQAMSTDDIPF